MADDNYDDLYNSDVVDRDGKKIGGVGQVYLDDKTGQPTWVTIKTGLFGTKESFVPLDQAELSTGQIKVPYAEEYVKNAPSVDPDRHLDADEEAELYKYYGIATVTAEQAEQTESAGQPESVENPEQAKQAATEQTNPAAPEVIPADATPATAPVETAIAAASMETVTQPAIAESASPAEPTIDAVPATETAADTAPAAEPTVEAAPSEPAASTTAPASESLYDSLPPAKDERDLNGDGKVSFGERLRSAFGSRTSQAEATGTDKPE